METPESTPEEVTPEEQQEEEEQGGEGFDPQQAEGDDASGQLGS
jgi:hypothetical protein